MARLLGFLVIVALILGCIGYYFGWFAFSSNKTSDGKVNVGVSVDRQKMEDDAEKAKEKLKSLGGKGNEKADPNP